MVDSAAAALRQLLGFGQDPATTMLTAAQPSSDMMSPWMNSPAMVSQDPGMQTPSAPFMAGQDPTNMLPANPPLPPVRPSFAPPTDDSDDAPDPAPQAAPAVPAPAAAPAAPAGPAQAPATTIAAPPQAAPQAPGTASSPPDMLAMYKELMDKNERKNNFDSGMAMVAAGLSGSPEARSALLNMASNSSGANAQTQAYNTVNTLMQLRQMQTAQAQKTAQQGRLPQIAEQLHLPLSTVQYLDSTGKLDDLVTQAAKPDNELRQTSDGRLLLVSKTNAKVVADFGGAKEEDKNPKQIALLQGMKENWQNIPGVPNPDSQDPKDQQWWRDQSTRILGGGGGVNVSVNNTPERAKDMAIGQAVGGAIGKETGSYIEDGKNAQETIKTLDSLSSALDASKGSYTGPFADYVLQGKQALSGAFGVPIDGVNGQEAARKLNFALATQASKAISARPSQMEFMKAVDSQPGIFLTPEGNKAMIYLNRQAAQDRVNLAQLAHDPANQSNMAAVADNYYKTHPIMSPFNPNEPLGQNDFNLMYKAAQRDSATDPNVAKPNAAFLKPIPTPAAIAELRKSGHGDIADFDKTFGQGMAYHYLNGGN